MDRSKLTLSIDADLAEKLAAIPASGAARLVELLAGDPRIVKAAVLARLHLRGWSDNGIMAAMRSVDDWRAGTPTIASQRLAKLAQAWKEGRVGQEDVRLLDAAVAYQLAPGAIHGEIR